MATKPLESFIKALYIIEIDFNFMCILFRLCRSTVFVPMMGLVLISFFFVTTSVYINWSLVFLFARLVHSGSSRSVFWFQVVTLVCLLTVLASSGSSGKAGEASNIF